MTKATRWTDAKVAGIKAGAVRQVVSLGRGLYLVVHPSGTKTWWYRYKIAGRQQKVKLGAYPRMGLAAAEGKRNEYEADAEAARAGEGIAPADKAKVAAAERLAVPTIQEMSETWLTRRRKDGKALSEKTLAKRRHILEKEILPVLGAHRVTFVGRAHCHAVIDRPASREAMGQAAEVYKVLRALLRYAVERGHIQVSPLAGVPTPAKSEPRDRYLSDDEVKALFAALAGSDVSNVARLCLEFQLLTAARPSEAREARWSEIDGDVWRIPESRSKSRRPHTVYLSDAAVDVLKRAKKFKARGAAAPIFPGRTDGEPLSSLTVTRAVSRLQIRIRDQYREITGNRRAKIEPFTLHDLRRTAASMVTGLGHTRLIAGLMLNHKDRSVTAIYDRYDYEPELRAAWQDLGRHIGDLIAQ